MKGNDVVKMRNMPLLYMVNVMAKYAARLPQVQLARGVELGVLETPAVVHILGGIGGIGSDGGEEREGEREREGGESHEDMGLCSTDT
ncbi:hypothetical protein EYF80_010868 [Liparis tanakae]|uniref:Uncharacterized protein n=1 Tax=Liparis tanakae TaxID=230148 RepID=A0A4Z2INY9_9TELE|nr:hypothetical protein EYF80_010868 [Liparis tanakae]